MASQNPASTEGDEKSKAEVWDDIDLHEDEKEYVQATNEELEEIEEEDDEFDEAKEFDLQAPAEYAQKWPGGKTWALVAYHHGEKKAGKKEETKTRKGEKKKGPKMGPKMGQKMQKEGGKAKDEGFEEAKPHHPAAEKAPEDVDEEVVDVEAGSHGAQ